MTGLYRVFFSELIGTGLLIGIGLSVVISAFGVGSPVVAMFPDPCIRRPMAGFLFGLTGGLIALSQVGKISGAHINPAVTFAFWVLGKMKGRIAALYVLAQFAGAVLGALPLLLWGELGRSVQYGATSPGPAFGVWIALAGETATTFALVTGLFLFIGHRRLSAFTPLFFPFLYAFMVFLEGPISGTSTNPARSLGPAVVSGEWRGWWIYLAGPAIGSWFATVVQSRTALKRFEIRVAKIYHFKHDPHGIFSFKS